MKKIVGMTLLLTYSFVSEAREQFGGILLDSSIPAVQQRIIKEDFTYLYNNPLLKTDPLLQSTLEIASIDGPHLYNWIHNRIKYIIGQNYKYRGRNLVQKKGHRFPNTPLPPSILRRTNSYANVIIMSNLGAELYLLGKRDNVLKGIKLDRKNVFAPSPRVGIVQIGEGHFLERLLINNNPSSEANKIKRLGTIFHEARHGDGHSEHVGFIHNKCPMGHPLSGFNACEDSSNGAYSLEAQAMKTLLLNCRTCSTEDKTKITANIADSYSRVVVRSHVKSESQILEEMATFQRVVDFYENLIATHPNVGEPTLKELVRLKAKVKELEDQLAELRTPMEPKKLDATPEGSFEEVSVQRSSLLMRASLAK